jgi:hypothetical protein
MSRKPRYVKIRLELDIKMTDNFLKTIENDELAIQSFIVRNVFHNNPWKLRHKNMTEIPEVEFLAK